jgi:ABC-type taurine transport system substrate-binding protein
VPPHLLTTRITTMKITFEQVQAIADRESNLALTRETIVEAFERGDIDANEAYLWAGELGIELALV